MFFLCVCASTVLNDNWKMFSRRFSPSTVEFSGSLTCMKPLTSKTIKWKHILSGQTGDFLKRDTQMSYCLPINTLILSVTNRQLPPPSLHAGLYPNAVELNVVVDCSSGVMLCNYFP